jgi:hypothetical protein
MGSFGCKFGWVLISSISAIVVSSLVYMVRESFLQETLLVFRWIPVVILVVSVQFLVTVAPALLILVSMKIEIHRIPIRWYLALGALLSSAPWLALRLLRPTRDAEFFQLGQEVIVKGGEYTPTGYWFVLQETVWITLCGAAAALVFAAVYRHGLRTRHQNT